MARSALPRRESIDTFIYHFRLCATAEEIGYKFASVSMADIYEVINKTLS